MDAFEEKTIFEQITDSRRSLQFLDFHYAFFLNDESIFFLGNDGLTQANRFTGKTVKLDIPVKVLTRYSVSEGEAYTYEDIVAYDFCG